MAVTLTEAKVFRDVWSIQDFLCRMRPNTASVDRGNQSEGGPSSCLRTKRMTVPLRGRGAGQSSEWRLTCWPNQASESGDLQNAVELRLINYTKNKNQDGEVEAKVIIGLRDKYGDLDVVKHVVCKVRNEQMISATVPHEKITASADRLTLRTSRKGTVGIQLKCESIRSTSLSMVPAPVRLSHRNSTGTYSTLAKCRPNEVPLGDIKSKIKH